MKVKKTYRLEQETIDELEKLCSDSGKSATEVIEGAIHDAIRLPDTERAGEGWAQTVTALTEQLAVKDDQIASLGRALEAAQETAKAAQALHAANVQERIRAGVAGIRIKVEELRSRISRPLEYLMRREQPRQQSLNDVLRDAQRAADAWNRDHAAPQRTYRGRAR